MARPLALVTGASSGIGAAYAVALAARGHDLILVARRRERLEAVAAPLRATGAAVETIVADLGTRDGVAQIAALCIARPLALLVNNAGVAHYMPFAQLPPERASEVMQVNAVAVLDLSRAALGGMIERDRGAIINVGSLLAFSGELRGRLPPRAVYAATKAFLLTFTQALAGELEGTNVKAQVVCPGLVVSEFHTRQGLDLSAMPRMSSEDVVTASLADLDAGVVVCLPPIEDRSALDAITAAQATLVGQASQQALAGRYRA
ncbi:MAG: short-chain dehydrogenase/reductase [Myxococcales bacterium]|jgi:short-subunit dehydrogenase|nr:short-chain dehydrogenase/reductase [Myxococcales bacterium]